MNYFDGIEFIGYGNRPDYRVWHRNHSFADYYGIQYNHSGSCQLQIDDQDPMVLGDGYVFFTAPGHFYTYGVHNSETRHHCFVCFKGERVDSFIKGGLFSPDSIPPVFKVYNSEKFYQSMLELHNLLRYPAGFRNHRRVHLLEGLLLQIGEQPPVGNNVNPYLLNSIDALRRKIVEKSQKDWNFEEEAKKIAVSYPHFRRLFRQVTGFSPTHFLIECRLNSASRMLLESNLPINEIAHLCGYQDEFYFYRLFRQYRFCTASAYRKKFGM